jgi:hypothetical protein
MAAGCDAACLERDLDHPAAVHFTIAGSQADVVAHRKTPVPVYHEYGHRFPPLPTARRAPRKL